MKKNSQKYKRIVGVLLLSIFYFLFSYSVYAAQFQLVTPQHTIPLNSRFRIDMQLDTQGYEVNALEGKLIFSSEAIKLIAIEEGNSIVPLWIERPRELSPGAVSFSGVMPAGFSGGAGHILSFVFRTQKSGEEAIVV